MTSFVGAFPYNDPEYIILVSLDNPKGEKGIRGSLLIGMSAPVAGEIIKLVAPQLNIPIQNSFDAFQEYKSGYSMISLKILKTIFQRM